MTRYILLCLNKTLVDLFRRCIEEIVPYAPLIDVLLVSADLSEYLRLYDIKNSALAAPTNSLGLMGGGFDEAIAKSFGVPFDKFEAVMMHTVTELFGGYMPPCTANVVELEKTFSGAGVALAGAVSHVSHIVQLPTMVVPEPVNPLVVFDCTWQLLRKTHSRFDAVIFPAFAAGYGGVKPSVASQLMAGAIGLFHMDLPPDTKAAAILLFLQKDPEKFGKTSHILLLPLADKHCLAKIAESEYPLPWSTLMARLGASASRVVP